MEVLNYRGIEASRRVDRSRVAARLTLVIGILVALMHLVGSHVILFHINSPRFYTPGPGGPVDTPLLRVFEFPLYPHETQWVSDMGQWNTRFKVVALMNAVLWGVAAVGVLCGGRAMFVLAVQTCVTIAQADPLDTHGRKPLELNVSDLMCASIGIGFVPMHALLGRNIAIGVLSLIGFTTAFFLAARSVIRYRIREAVVSLAVSALGIVGVVVYLIYYWVALAPISMIWR